MDVQSVFRQGGTIIKNPLYDDNKKKNKHPKYITVNSLENRVPPTDSAGANILFGAASSGNNSILGRGDELDKYISHGITPNKVDDLDLALARQQSAWTQTGNMLAQTIGAELAIGVPKGVSDLLDMGINAIGRATGVTENDYTNPLSQTLEDWQNKIREEAAIHYDHRDDDSLARFTHWGYYMSNAPSIISSLTLLIPGVGMAKLSKLALFNKSVKAFSKNAIRTITGAKSKLRAAEAARKAGESADKIAEVGKLNKFQKWANSPYTANAAENFVQTAVTASTMRAIENYQEARQTFSDTYATASNKLNSLSDEEYQALLNNNPDLSKDLEENNIDPWDKDKVAKRIATRSADLTFKLDWANVIFDMWQLYSLKGAYRGLKNVPNTPTAVHKAQKYASRYAGKYKTQAEFKDLMKSRSRAQKTKDWIADASYATKNAFLAEGSEGIEEGINYIAQQQGMHLGNILIGEEKGKVNESFWKNTFNGYDGRLKDYMEDPAFYDSVLWGVIGGIVFNASASKFERVKATMSERNAAKNTKDEDKVEGIDDKEIPWWKLSQTNEVQRRIDEIHDRNIAYAELLDNIKKVREGIDVEHSTDKLTVRFQTPVEMREAEDRLKRKYIRRLTLNSMNSGNLNMLKAFFAEDNMRKAMIETGLFNEEGVAKSEADLESESKQFVNETLRIINETEDKYDRELVAVDEAATQFNNENAKRSKDEKNPIPEIQAEYIQLIALRNMRLQNEFEDNNTELAALTASIAEKYQDLVNTGKLDPNIDYESAIHAGVVAHKLGQLRADRKEILSHEEQSLSDIISLKEIDRQIAVLEKDLTDAQLAFATFQSLKYVKNEDGSYEQMQSGQDLAKALEYLDNAVLSRQQGAETDLTELLKLDKLGVTGRAAKALNDESLGEYNTLLDAAKKVFGTVKKQANGTEGSETLSNGSNSLNAISAELNNMYQRKASIEESNKFLRDGIARTPTEVGRQAMEAHNTMNAMRIIAINRSLNVFKDLYKKYGNPLRDAILNYYAHNTEDINANVPIDPENKTTFDNAISGLNLDEAEIADLYSAIQVTDLTKPYNTFLAENIDDMFRLAADEQAAENAKKGQKNTGNKNDDTATDSSNLINPPAQPLKPSDDQGNGSQGQQGQQNQSKKRMVGRSQFYANKRGVLEAKAPSEKSDKPIVFYDNGDGTYSIDVTEDKTKLNDNRVFDSDDDFDILSDAGITVVKMPKAKKVGKSIQIVEKGIIKNTDKLTDEDRAIMAEDSPSTIPTGEGSQLNDPIPPTNPPSNPPTNPPSNPPSKPKVPKHLTNLKPGNMVIDVNGSKMKFIEHKDGMYRFESDGDNNTVQYKDEDANRFQIYDTEITDEEQIKEIKARIEGKEYIAPKLYPHVPKEVKDKILSEAREAKDKLHKEFPNFNEKEAITEVNSIDVQLANISTSRDQCDAKDKNFYDKQYEALKKQSEELHDKLNKYKELKAQADSKTRLEEAEKKYSKPNEPVINTGTQNQFATIEIESALNLEYLRLKMANKGNLASITDEQIDEIADKFRKAKEEEGVSDEILDRAIAGAKRTIKRSIQREKEKLNTVQSSTSDVILIQSGLLTGEPDIVTQYYNAIKTLFNDYANEVKLHKINGKVPVNLEDLFRYINKVYEDPLTARMLFNNIKQYIIGTRSDEYILIDESEIVNPDFLDNVDKTQEERDKERLEYSNPYRIDIYNFENEEQKTEFDEAFEELNIGDTVTYDVDSNNKIIFKDNKGRYIGSMTSAQVDSTTGIFTKFNENFKYDVSVDKDGNIISKLYDLYTKWFNKTDDNCKELFDIIYEIAYDKNITKERKQELLDKFKNNKEIKDAINSGFIYTDEETTDAELNEILDKALNHLGKVMRYVTNNTSIHYNRQLNNALYIWFDKLNESYKLVEDLKVNKDHKVVISNINEGEIIRLGTAEEGEKLAKPVQEAIAGGVDPSKHRVAVTNNRNGNATFVAGHDNLNVNFSGGSTFITIPNRSGKLECVNAYPAKFTDSYVSKDIADIMSAIQEHIDKLLDRYAEVQSDETWEDLIEFIKDCFYNKQRYSSFIKGIGFIEHSKGFNLINNGVTISFFRYRNNVRTPSIRVKISNIDNDRLTIKDSIVRDKIKDFISKASFNIAINHVKSDNYTDMDLTGLAQRENGKFVIKIGDKTWEYNSYNEFVLNNNLIRVNTAPNEKGTSNFNERGVRSAKTNKILQVRIDEKIKEEGKGNPPNTEPKNIFNLPANKFIDALLSDSYKSANKGLDIVKYVFGKDENKLNAFKRTGLIPKTIIFDPEFNNKKGNEDVNAEVNKRTKIVTVGTKWVEMFKNPRTRDEAIRKLIHEQIHIELKGKLGYIRSAKSIYNEFKEAIGNGTLQEALDKLGAKHPDGTKIKAEEFRRFLFEKKENELVRLEEFFVEALTSSDLFLALNNIKAKDYKAKKTKNLFTKIVEFISEVFGWKVKEGSLYEKALNTIRATFKESQEISENEKVAQMHEDSKHINLTEDELFYLNDLTKTIDVRITTAIEADLSNYNETLGDVKRFNKNSPYVIPSTNIGTGVDEFVRDFFLGKLDTLTEEELEQNYPNADGFSWNEFRKQLVEFKNNLENGKLFAGKHLKIVSRNITPTGEVEITMPDGSKKMLHVSGTLDLLAYDEDNNFYIFDMKTVHNKNNIGSLEYQAKWNRQLQMYKQLLEKKYDIHVEKTGIIPILVKYETPKGATDKEGNDLGGTTEYTVANPELKTQYDNPNRTQLLEDGVEFRGAAPNLQPYLPIETKDVDIRYEYLSDQAKAVADGRVTYEGYKNGEIYKEPKQENTPPVEVKADNNTKPSGRFGGRYRRRRDTDTFESSVTDEIQINNNDYTSEMQSIKDKAIADGTFMKAPNGNSTNLNERQWLQVRTKAFKDWFGDWESIAPKGESSSDTVGGSPVALSYLLEGGPKTIESTGYLLHGISAAFELITSEIEEIRNKYLNQIDSNPSNFKNDTTGALQEIKAIIDKTYGQQGLNILGDILNNATGFYIREGVKVQNRLDELNNIIRNAKNKNVSKVVDENGEPLVVYHSSPEYNISVFKDTDSISFIHYPNETIEEAINRYKELGYKISSEQIDNIRKNNYNKFENPIILTKPNGIYAASNRKVSETYITRESYEEGLYLDGEIYPVFLNIRDNNIIEGNNSNWNEIPYKGKTVSTRELETEFRGIKDGVIIKNIFDFGSPVMDTHKTNLSDIFIVYNPNQIKSATSNNGEFSTTNDDIRHSSVNDNIDTTTINLTQTQSPQVFKDNLSLENQAKFASLMAEDEFIISCR